MREGVAPPLGKVQLEVLGRRTLDHQLWSRSGPVLGLGGRVHERKQSSPIGGADPDRMSCHRMRDAAEQRLDLVAVLHLAVGGGRHRIEVLQIWSRKLVERLIVSSSCDVEPRQARSYNGNDSVRLGFRILRPNHADRPLSSRPVAKGEVGGGGVPR